jgi:hypothetical protein
LFPHIKVRNRLGVFDNRVLRKNVIPNERRYEGVVDHRIKRSFMIGTLVHLMELSTKFDYKGRTCSIHRKEEKHA